MRRFWHPHHFASFTGRLQLAGPDLENSTAELAIDPASIDTSNPDRDAHLRSADFFDTGRFPKMRFGNSSVRRESTDTFTVTGELTMKGTARPVELHLTLLGSAVDPYGQFRLGFTAPAPSAAATGD